jgi:hypothetical protein
MVGLQASARAVNIVLLCCGERALVRGAKIRHHTRDPTRIAIRDVLQQSCTAIFYHSERMDDLLGAIQAIPPPLDLGNPGRDLPRNGSVNGPVGIPDQG